MKEYIVQAKDNYDFWDLVIYQDGEKLKELIRCKGCKYAKCIEQNDDWWECSHDKRVMHGDGFCSWAERKEE